MAPLRLWAENRHQRDHEADQVIPLTVNEIRRLFATLTRPDRPVEHTLAWSHGVDDTKPAPDTGTTDDDSNITDSAAVLGGGSARSTARGRILPSDTPFVNSTDPWPDYMTDRPQSAHGASDYSPTKGTLSGC
jgi:hypothetical protein